MGNTTGKKIGRIDAENVLRKAYNVEDATVSVNGFVVGKVGHKIELEIRTTNVANDTERFTFSDQSPGTSQDNPTGGPLTLYIIDVIYTDGNRSQLMSVERVA